MFGIESRWAIKGILSRFPDISKEELWEALWGIFNAPNRLWKGFLQDISSPLYYFTILFKEALAGKIKVNSIWFFYSQKYSRSNSSEFHFQLEFEGELCSSDFYRLSQ